MKSVTVKGSFSRHHCSNKCHRGHSRPVKPPLLFKESKHSSSILPSCTSFSTFLNEENVKTALGPVDVQWFEKVSNRENGGTNTKCGRDSEQHADECRLPKTASASLESPAKLLKAHELTLTLQTLASQPLFTPNVEHHVPQQINNTQDKNKHTESTSLCDLGKDVNPVAQLNSVTPDVREQRRNKMTPTLLDISWSPAEMRMPSPADWYPANRQMTTPTFMKQLFKTPSSVSKLTDFSLTTPGPFLSTPMRMSVSLGADLNDSNLSWTSSLATPQGSTTKNTLAESHLNWDQALTVVPKALFTSTTELPAIDTQQQRGTDPDSQVNSVPLQSLHMSSMEDDVFETTIKSDAEDGDVEEKVTEDTVVCDSVAMDTVAKDMKAERQDEVDGMGNHRTILKRRHLVDEDCPGMEEMTHQQERTDLERQLTDDVDDDTKIKNGKNPQRKVRRIMQDEAGERITRHDHESQVLSQRHLSQEDYPTAISRVGCEQRLHYKESRSSNRQFPTKSMECLRTPSDLPEDNLRDKLLNSPDVQVPVTSSTLKPSSCKTWNDSQKSIHQEMPSNSQELDKCNLSSLDRSRMEDTLAFFLLTPPQTRSRLAKLKNRMFEKSNDCVSHNENLNTQGPKCPSLEEERDNVSKSCRCESAGERNTLGHFGTKELLRIEEIRPTKEHSQVSVLEEDNSIKVVKHSSESRPNQLCCHKRDEVGSSDSLSQKIRNDTRNEELQVSQSVKIQTLAAQNVGSITPVRQTKAVPSPSKFSPDAFSQISPHFVDALCQMTDQVSSSTNIQSEELVKCEVHLGFLKPDQNELSYESSHSSFKTPSACLKHGPEPSKDEHLPLAGTSKSNPPTTAETKVPSDDVEGSSQYETPGQLFRMQPKASSSRRFFYPSAVTANLRSSKRRSIQWLTEAVLVENEENQQQREDRPTSVESSSPKMGKGLTDGTNDKPNSSGGCNSIFNSTPAPRNSAFVTFNNFVKSEKHSLSGLSYASSNTDRHPRHGLMASSKPQQAVPFGSENSLNSITSNQTTPLSWKTANVRSSSTHCGSRRRAGAHGLPPPKRLKTVMDEEQIRLEKPQTFGIETIADSTSKSLARVGSIASQDLKVENHFDRGSQDKVRCHSVSIPAAKNDFSSNSGISIQDVTTRSEQPLANGKELQNGSIPRSVTFASASGKPIHIPESALEKAKEFWSDEQEDDIPPSVSRKGPQISDSSLAKTEASLREGNEEHSIKPTGGAVKHKSRETHPQNIGLKSASSSGYQAYNSSDLQDANVKKIFSPIKTLRSSSDQCESTARKTSNNFEYKSGYTPHTLENGNIEQAQPGGVISTPCSAKSPQQMSHEDSNHQKQIPAFTGFIFASGEKVTISETALQRAEKMMEEENVRIPTSVSFASAAGKPIRISEIDLEKAHALLEDIELTELPVSNKTHVPPQQPKANQLSKGSGTKPVFHQHHTKVSMNYHRLPKGFRPFKAPAKMETSIQLLQSDRRSEIVPNENTSSSFLVESKHLPTIPETDVLTVSPEGPTAERTAAAAEISEFEEEFLSASQAQREIEAAEETESAYAFMQAADDSFSQFENLSGIRVSLPTGINDPRQPGNDDVKISQKAEKLEDLTSRGDRIAESKEASIVEHLEIGSNPPSQVSSHAFDMLDKAFVQQDLATERRETEESSACKEKCYTEDDSGAPGLNTLGTDIRVHARSQESSPQISSKPFVGFCTASGHKVTVSNEALQKAKMFWDTGMNIEKTASQVPTEHCRTSASSYSKEYLKKDLSLDKVDGGCLHGKENASTVLRKSSLCAKEAASENEVNFKREMGNSQSPSVTGLHEDLKELKERKNDAMPFVGFQTAGGRPVLVSEEALVKAKSLFQEEEENRSAVWFPEAPQSKVSGAITENRDKPFTSFSVGFQTASGSKVDISEESLMTARRVLDSSERHTNKQPSARNRSGKIEGKCTVPCGFTTASGSKVNILQESLQKVRNLIEVSCENLPADDISSTGTLTTDQPFAGFSTASGNKVSVSKAALEKAKRLLMDPDDSPMPTHEEMDRPKSQKKRVCKEQEGHVSLGFQTASGSSVSVSKLSLEKAKLMLDSPEKCEPLKSVGFQTGSGNKVKISAASLSNAEKFLAEDAAGRDERNQHHGFGFSTASGCKVEVSEAALQRAKKLFENLDDASAKSVSLQANASNQECGLVPASSSRYGTSQTPGEDLIDAVVPTSRVGSKKHADPNQNSVAQGLSRRQQNDSVFQRQTSCSTKQKPPAFKPPYQAPHKSSHSRQGSARQSDNLQVVPQMPIPLLPPHPTSATTSTSGDNGSLKLNKRAPDDNLRSCIPIAKRARVEVESLADKAGDVSSAVKQKDLATLGRWEQARKNQTSRIQSKKSQVIKPLPGKLFTKKQQGSRIPLQELVNGQPPEQYSRSQLIEAGVHQSAVDLTASSTADFKFRLADYLDCCVLESEDGLVLSDGGRLVPDEAGLAGTEEFFRALLDTPGVDPKLLSAGWVSNHYLWIVWKLVTMERAYPQELAGRFLTPDWVLMQLKYRYDREIDRAQRPALRKILERDDIPSRRMVLCVSGVQHAGTNTGVMMNPRGTGEKDKAPSLPIPTLELTDGWYSVKTIVDNPLAGLIKAGKIRIGQKLCICGAELVGSQDACSPLEVPDNLRLRITANCTRRARYDARLGLQRCPQPFSLTLASLYPEGGTVGCVDVVIIKTYPMQFMEKHSQGGCTFRGRRAEEREAGRFAQEKQKQMEKLFAKIQEEYEEKENQKVNLGHRSSGQKLTAKQVAKLQTGQELYEAFTDAIEPGALQALLSERQVALLGNYQRCLHDKQQTDMQGHFRRAMKDRDQEKQIQRNVTPLLRLRIADHLAKPKTVPQTYQLTIWRPTDDLMHLLDEGKRFKIFNLSASAGRFCLGSTNIQFSSTRATRYQMMPFQNDCGRDLYRPRRVTPFSEILQQGFRPVYGEVDAMGVVVSAVEHANQSSSQMVYLSDAAANLIAVKFWGGLQAQCLESVVQPGVFLACSNLQWRTNSASSCIPCLHASDGVSVTQNPKADYLREPLQKLQNQIKNPESFVKDLEQKVAEMVALQTRHSVPMTPKPELFTGGMSPALPWSGPRPVEESNNTLNVTLDARSSMSTIIPGAQAVNPCLSSLPSSKANQLGPQAVLYPFPAVSPRESIASTPRGGVPCSLPSTPGSDLLVKRRLDVIRRYDLLSRIPSPPSLSPLPTPVSNRVMRSFRPPSCRRSIVQQESSCLTKSPEKGSQRPGMQHGCCDHAKVAQHSGRPNKTALVTSSKQIVHNSSVADHGGDARPGAANSPDEEMTPSQQQVQEVLGMSYKCLREIDWEWTQQMDPPSPEPCAVSPSGLQPSPDFSYGTSSQSSSLTEEGLNTAPLSSDLNKNSVKQNTAEGKSNGDKREHSTSTVLTSDENGQGDCRRQRVSSSKRKLGRRKRGRTAQSPAVVLDTIQNTEPKPKEPTAVVYGGDQLKSKQCERIDQGKGPGPDGDNERVPEQEDKHLRGTSSGAGNTVEGRHGTHKAENGSQECGNGIKETGYGTRTGKGTEEAGHGTEEAGHGTKQAGVGTEQAGLGSNLTKLGSNSTKEVGMNKLVAKTEESTKGSKRLLCGAKEALGPSSSGDAFVKDETDKPETGVSRQGKRKQTARSRVDLSIIEQGAANSPDEEMSPSQQQVQKVLGMSYKCLGEIDWEWTQQMDTPSPEPCAVSPSGLQPSPDFSYGTSSQSSSLTEEGLNTAPLSSDLSKNSVKQNTAEGKSNGDKREHSASTVLTSDENGQGDC